MRRRDENMSPHTGVPRRRRLTRTIPRLGPSRPGLDPVAAHGALGDTQRGRNVLFLPAAEEPALDHLALPWVELLERLVQRQEVLGGGIDRRRLVAQGDGDDAAAALRRLPS